MKSVALSCRSMLLKPFVRDQLKLHIGQNIFEEFGAVYANGGNGVVPDGVLARQLLDVSAQDFPADLEW